MNFYKHHIGDYDADTAHLSMLEDGAYRRLMSLYYRRETPIPSDVGQACRLVRAVSKQDREAVESVLSEFFALSDDGWRHKRCDEEIAAAQDKAKANRENGKGGGRPKKEPNAAASGNPNETQTPTDQKPSGFSVGSNVRAGPTASNQTPDSNSEANASAAAAAPLGPKERIWAMGVALLGEKGRSHVGKLIATYGEAVLLEVLAEATREQPIDAKAWIVAACEAKKRPKQRNGDHPTTRDLLERDPRPDWVVQAGFSDIFAAESAGCGPRNAHAFHDGRKTA